MKPAGCDLTPHEALLRACAATSVDAPARRTVDVALSAPNLDWSATVRMSIRHGMAQHVAWHLNGFAGDPRIPSKAAECFERMYRANGVRNAVLFRETARMLHALQTAGIPALVLKGVGLALTIYAEPALRNCADLDILVDPSHLEAALRIAEISGFVREAVPSHPQQVHVLAVATCPEDILTETLAPEFDTSFAPEALAPYCHQIPMEVHRGLFRRPSGHLRDMRDMADFRLDARSAALPGGTVLWMPSPEAMLVHLSAHAAHHVFKRLIFPLDMVNVIRHDGSRIDWDRVVHLTALYEVRDPVYRMLEFVQHEFRVELPPGVLERIEAGGSVQPLALTEIFRAAQMDQSAESLERLACLGNWRERLIAIRQILVPPVPSMQRFYGTRSMPRISTLYLLRPFNLAARLVRVLYRRLRQRIARWGQ